MAESLADIEKAGSQLEMCSALAKDSDTLVANAIDWYSCMHPNLSPTQIRRRQRLIRDAVGDYLYVAGSNLKCVVESLPDDYNQDLLARVVAEKISQLVPQLYPELPEAMQRALTTGQQPEKRMTRKRFVATQEESSQKGVDREMELMSICIDMETV
ncbi:MAG: hypothetical protein AAGC93_23805 [Cyanobacteria bacterium P01_F01_bin.53]